MKNLIKYILILLVIMLPFMVNAKENVEIISVSKVSQSGTAEVGTATFEGLTVNFDVTFAQQEDEVVYKMIIKNNDNKAYELEKGELVNNNRHIKYTLDYKGGNIISANSTKEATVTIKYYNLVEENEFINGRYSDNNQMSINLRNNVTNPQTSSTIIVIFLILLILIATVVVYKSSPRRKLLTILVLTLLVPVATLAADRIQIIINAKVEIQNVKKFCIYDLDEDKTLQYKYVDSMTLDEYCDSKFANIRHICSWSDGELVKTEENVEFRFFTSKIMSCINSSKGQSTDLATTIYSCINASPDDSLFVKTNEDKIQDESNGCYVYQELITR